jgi:transposase
MAYKPTRMNQIRKIIEYRQNGLSIRRIARLLGMSRNTVKQYIRRFEERDLSIKDLDDPELSREIYRSDLKTIDPREEDFQERLPKLIKELGKVGVSRQLLWTEYINGYPKGFSYSRFCRRIKQYKAVQNATLRLEHKAAYRLSIDFTGKKISWVNKHTGEIHECEVLVCTLPFSGYTFACATASQKQEDFIDALNQCFLYIGGLPKVLLSDNLKSYVTKANRYEPTFSELCVQLSSYYGVELEATRVGKPKDKAHVERHVGIIYNRLYGPLRNEVFHSQDEINTAFLTELEKHNSQNFQGKDYSRKDRFEKDEKPHLLSLPRTMFEVKKSTQAKVQRNYHVILGEDKHQYSVPYQYIGKTTQVIYTSRTVEVFVSLDRIAIHKRDRRKHGYSTFGIHMPEKHKKYLEQRGWDAPYFINQAQKIGLDTTWAMEQILQSKCIIEQTYNTCLGVLRLADKYTPDRLEKACTRARSTHRVTYSILKNILKKNLDQLPIQEPNELFTIPIHNNIRGAQNYQ